MSESCIYRHTTYRGALASIAKRGLLPREDLEKLGLPVRFPGFTVDGKVYVHTKDSFSYWNTDTNGGLPDQDFVTLCIGDLDPDRLQPDRHFNPDSCNFEHRGPIPPQALRVHSNARGCTPLEQYLKETCCAS